MEEAMCGSIDAEGRRNGSCRETKKTKKKEKKKK
jgi:hypothetical protein